jgi:RNA polymerase sigma factor (sigma-70 family)
MSALFRAARTTDFDRLYRRYAASVYRYAYAVLGNHADAEDVTQQTFMNAYRAIARGTRPRKAENWLLTIAHNEVRRHFRSARAKAHEVEFDENLEQPAPERSEPSLADVLRALQHLPPAQRSALVMREFEGRSYAEIAQIMNVTQSALETQVFRARRALAEHLEGGLTCDEAEQAISRRLDGRLPRRVTRRLKAHLRECPVCERFAEVQKRQRALLKGLSVMPIPASLFLFRGEQAAASAGLGAAVGSGGAATGGGLAAGVAAKAAAVTAAAAVAGGVGYGVTANPKAVTKPAPPVAKAAVVAEPRPSRPAARSHAPRKHTAAVAIAHVPRKAGKANVPRAKPVQDAEKAARKALVAEVKLARATAKSARHDKVRPTKTRSPDRSRAAKPEHKAQPRRAKPARQPKLPQAKALHAPPGRTKPKPPSAGSPQQPGAEPNQKKK